MDGVRITGLRETVRSLERMGVGVQDLREAFRDISDQVVTEAGPLVQYETGASRATIRPGNTKNKSVVRAGNAANPQAGILNYGWPARGITGSEFLTGPANSNTAEHVQKIEANLQSIIRKYGLK